MRASRALALLALLCSTLSAGGVVAGGPAAASGVPLTWCAGSSPSYPCVDRMTRAGVEVTEDDPDWSVTGVESTSDGSRTLSLSVLHNGSTELGSGSIDRFFDITLKVGSLVPRVVTGNARDVTVTRGSADGVNTVRVEATPVPVSGRCTGSPGAWTCPEESVAHSQERDALIAVEVTDEGGLADPRLRDAMDGLHWFSNVAATSGVPELWHDAHGDPVLRLRMANRHYLADGTTPFQGHGELRIPNSLLREFLDIPNPGTMTSTSLLADLTGSTAKGYLVVAAEASGGARLVGFDGKEFSARTLEVRRGVVNPGPPHKVRAKRTGVRAGWVKFRAAHERGARVTGYQARCTPPVGRAFKATGKRTTQKFARLRPNVRYDCRVRARSQAGWSAWSPKAKLPARP